MQRTPDVQGIDGTGNELVTRTNGKRFMKMQKCRKGMVKGKRSIDMQKMQKNDPDGTADRTKRTRTMYKIQQDRIKTCNDVDVMQKEQGMYR